MSWFVENSMNIFQKFCVKVLKCGPIPRHVAFIMDGNRRYAKKANVDKKDGHSKGFEKLTETLQWCLEMGIKEVTVYAFSIENFKRTPEEVDTLMNLASEKFQCLLDEREKLMSEGVCVRVIGDLSLLREDLRSLIAKAMLMTKDNNRTFLNVAFPYTSTNELVNVMKCINEGIHNDCLSISDVNETLISSCLYTQASPNPDILIRTSGEVRLSDFLLWQVENSFIYFSEVLWPEFSFWDFFKCIFSYQCSIRKSGLDYIKRKHNDVLTERGHNFVNDLQICRLRELENYTAA